MAQAQLRELDQALTLVGELCSTEQVKALLRLRRDNDDVRLSAENKKLLIDRNLADAVRKGAVPLEAVWDLIRSSEENGSQHIFYYKVKPNLLKHLHPEAVAERMFGGLWKKKLNTFPQLALKPESYIISDFRALKHKPLDWLCKIYGHATIVRPTGNQKPRENGKFWREYEDVPLRSVLVVRWNHPDLLEIRIQSDDSRQRMAGWQSTVWSMLQAGVSKEQFSPWALNKTLRKVVLDCKKHTKLYTFRDAGVLDKDGRVMAHFETVSDQGDLLESQRSIDNLIEYVRDGGTLKGLAVTWLADKTSMSKDYRVLVGGRQEHEVLFQAKCAAGDVDHVTDQLRRFS